MVNKIPPIEQFVVQLRQWNMDIFVSKVQFPDDSQY